jgi:hypothetical protein
MNLDRTGVALAARFLAPALFLLAAPAAQAVPSFARQTGLACEACHTVWPELTHFGRVFKANGYILENLKSVKGVTTQKEEILSLASLPPLSLMVQVGYSQLATSLPDNTGNGTAQNGTVAFPQQISLFYAGKIAPHGGAFIQLTYGNDSGTIGIDNTDIRFADLKDLPGGQSLIYGVSLNNNPTVQDLWNTTPAFGFPYAASNSAPGVPAGTMIDGALGQDVAGLTAYLFWNESLYGEVGLYRTARQGTAGPLDSGQAAVLSGSAPYWRVAYEHNWGRHSIEGGLYGATFKMLPGAGTPLAGPTDRFNDVAEDVQYQYMGDAHLVSFTGTRIHEKQTLDATYAGGEGGSSNASNDLTTTRLNLTYYYKRKLGGTVGYFSTTGSADDGIYSGGGNSTPDTKGWVAELNYMPWLNTKFSIQYTAYNKYSGGSSYLWNNNPDTNGGQSVAVPRKASDNNTLYLLAWLSY